MVRLVRALGKKKSNNVRHSRPFWGRLDLTRVVSPSRMLQRLLYYQGQWLDAEVADLDAIRQAVPSLIPTATELTSAKPEVNFHRAIIREMVTDQLEAYVKSIQLHQLARRQGYRRLPFMAHALPLDEQSYPSGWSLTVPQAYVKSQRSQNRRVLVCLTGQSGMLDMPIPYFHSWAHHAFDVIVYLYDSSKSQYVPSRPLIVEALRDLLKTLGLAHLCFTGVSYGGVNALWLHQAMAESKGVLATSPTLLAERELMDMVCERPAQALRGVHLFFSSRNKIDSANYRHLFRHLGEDFFVEHIFDLGWASASHACMGTLMTMGCLGNQLNWLRSQCD